jgi:hypothetical protein
VGASTGVDTGFVRGFGYKALQPPSHADAATRLSISAKPVKSEHGPPMTLGNAAAARVRLIIWCKECGHQVEPDPAEMAGRYGAETPVGASGWSAANAG